MTNQSRDKFLTEAMGECTHPELFDSKAYQGRKICRECGRIDSLCHTIDFSTWTGFGKLWEWGQKQEWWESFIIEGDFTHSWGTGLIPSEHEASWITAMLDIVNPTNFANALYEFLKEREER